MGLSHGTGQPAFFRCSKCRRTLTPYERNGVRCTLGAGAAARVVLTGRTRAKNDGRSAGRSTNTLREYRCLDCGHVGWSRHVGLTAPYVRR